MPVNIVQHPLITHKLSIIRNKETKMKEFRELVSEVTLLLTYEATRNLEMKPVEVETPLCLSQQQRLEEERFVIAPILRAGLGMLNGVVTILPLAKVAHLGVKRDEATAIPHTYYVNMPSDLEGSHVFIIDPMLATAGSMDAVLNFIKQGKPKAIKAICLIAAPEGKERMERDHPDVEFYVGALDEKLDERCFIVPGLGDAGDRMFGTL